MKISPWDLRDSPQDLIDFKDEVTTILNFGKYQCKVLYEATPTWVGKEGEAVLAYVTQAGTNLYNLYTFWYVNSAWRWTYYVGVTA
jgi:hypothetical protein